MKHFHSGQYRREPLRPEEVRALRVTASRNPIDRTIIETLLTTGLRVAEFAALEESDVDTEQCRLTVRSGKGGRRRVVYVSRRLALELARYLRRARRPRKRGIQRRLVALRSLAVIARPCTPHVLRHTFAVRALQAGLSLASLQQALGHRSLATTAIYLNLSPDAALAEMREKLDPRARARRKAGPG